MPENPVSEVCTTAAVLWVRDQYQTFRRESVMSLRVTKILLVRHGDAP